MHVFDGTRAFAGVEEGLGGGGFRFADAAGFVFVGVGGVSVPVADGRSHGGGSGVGMCARQLRWERALAVHSYCGSEAVDVSISCLEVLYR